MFFGFKKKVLGFLLSIFNPLCSVLEMRLNEPWPYALNMVVLRHEIIDNRQEALF
jgi:hypothetical protein